MSKSRPDHSASKVEQDLTALLRIDAGASPDTAMHGRPILPRILAPAAGRCRRDLGLLIGFPLALLLGVVTVSTLRDDGSFAAERDRGERIDTPIIPALPPARTLAPAPEHQSSSLSRHKNVIIVRNVPTAPPTRYDRPKSKTAIRFGGKGAEIPAPTRSEQPRFEVAEDNGRSQPGEEPRNEVIVDVAKVRRVTRTETIDDIRFLKLQ